MMKGTRHTRTQISQSIFFLGALMRAKHSFPLDLPFELLHQLLITFFPCDFLNAFQNGKILSFQGGFLEIAEIITNYVRYEWSLSILSQKKKSNNEHHSWVWRQIYKGRVPRPWTVFLNLLWILWKLTDLPSPMLNICMNLRFICVYVRVLISVLISLLSQFLFLRDNHAMIVYPKLVKRKI